MLAPARVALLAIATLTACGGGGGVEPVNVALSPTSIDAVALLEAQAQTYSTVRVTLLSGSGSYYFGITLSSGDAFTASFQPTGATTADIVLAPVATEPGDRSGTVEFSVCEDQACTRVAWRRTVPYRLRTFRVLTPRLDLTATEGTTSSPAAIEVTPADTAGRLTVVGDPSSDLGGRLSASVTSPTAFAVSGSASALGAGVHDGAACVVLSGLPASSGRCIPVTLAVSNGLVTPAPQVLALDAATTPAGLAGQVAVAFHGGLDRAWSATSDQAWLVLDRPSGPAAGPLGYTVDPAVVAARGHGAAEVATLRLSSPGLSTVTTTVRFENRLPEIRFTSPPAVVAGQAATVRVFGKGLAQLHGPSGLTLGGALTGTVTPVSDQELLLGLPALPVGRGALAAPNAFGAAARGVDLPVVAPLALAATFTPSGGEKRSAFFDAGRGAVYAADWSGGRVVRFRASAGGWQEDSVPLPDLGEIGLSADRRTLYATSGGTTLHRLDPDTLLPLAAPLQAPNRALSIFQFRTSGATTTQDGRAWFNTSNADYLTYFDAASGQFVVHPGLGPYGTNLSGAAFAAPADGSSLLFQRPQRQEGSFLLTTADDRLTHGAALPSFSWRVTFAPRGELAVVDAGKVAPVSAGAVLETAGWTALGRLDLGAGGTILGEAFSPDGSLLYVVAASRSGGVRTDRILVLRSREVAPGTSDLVALGELPVTALAGDCGLVPEYYCTDDPVVLISPTGDALLLVGNRGLVVVPVPEALRGP